jgi:predicted nucleotidyltransferase
LDVQRFPIQRTALTPVSNIKNMKHWAGAFSFTSVSQLFSFSICLKLDFMPDHISLNLMDAPFLAPHLDAIRQLCRMHTVRRLDVFGSVLSDAFSVDSDIDFLVEFDRQGYEGAFEQFMGFKEQLEALLLRPVDLVVSRPFRNPHFQQEVDQTKRLIYAA